MPVGSLNGAGGGVAGGALENKEFWLGLEKRLVLAKREVWGFVVNNWFEFPNKEGPEDGLMGAGFCGAEKEELVKRLGFVWIVIGFSESSGFGVFPSNFWSNKADLTAGFVMYSCLSVTCWLPKTGSLWGSMVSSVG